MTCPAAEKPSLPCKRIRRHAAIFSDKRNRVTSNSREGNTEKLTGSRMYMETIRMTTDTVMSTVIRMSSSSGGKGMIITAMQQMTAIGISRCEFRRKAGRRVSAASSAFIPASANAGGVPTLVARRKAMSGNRLLVGRSVCLRAETGCFCQ